MIYTNGRLDTLGPWQHEAPVAGKQGSAEQVQTTDTEMRRGFRALREWLVAVIALGLLLALCHALGPLTNSSITAHGASSKYTLVVGGKGETEEAFSAIPSFAVERSSSRNLPPVRDYSARFRQPLFRWARNSHLPISREPLRMAQTVETHRTPGFH